MKEIIAFLSPADKIRFENEVPHPTVICDTFEDFKEEIESRDESYVIKECMLIFSQDVSFENYDALIGLIDGHTNFVFRMFDTEADRSLDPEGYSKMVELEDNFKLKINVVNELYISKEVQGEFTGELCLRTRKSKIAYKNPDWETITFLDKK